MARKAAEDDGDEVLEVNGRRYRAEPERKPVTINGQKYRPVDDDDEDDDDEDDAGKGKARGKGKAEPQRRRFFT